MSARAGPGGPRASRGRSRRLGELRTALRRGGGDAEPELAAILRRLDEVNDGVGDCLAAARDTRR